MPSITEILRTQRVLIPGRGTPRNHGVMVDGVVAVIPAGNLREPPAPPHRAVTQTQFQFISSPPRLRPFYDAEAKARQVEAITAGNKTRHGMDAPEVEKIPQLAKSRDAAGKAAASRLRPFYDAEAKARQQLHGETAPGKTKTLPEFLPEVKKGDSRDAAGKARTWDSRDGKKWTNWSSFCAASAAVISLKTCL